MFEDETEIYERFRRPSNEAPLNNPYSFSDFEQPEHNTANNINIAREFARPRQVILAYFGILNRASNMMGYSGGCGSIGYGYQPYPYAYQLLTDKIKQKISLSQFINSFKGTGFITLLKLLPAYSKSGSSYLVEIETIQGQKETNDTEKLGTNFVYYYGIVTAKETLKGYLIDEIDLTPEDFLCAPEHHWFYMSDAVVEIVYGENLKIIDKIDRTEQDGDLIFIYASGNGKQYRFDFVRLTNGYDILLHENIYVDGIWKEINLPTQDWNMKLV